MSKPTGGEQSGYKSAYVSSTGFPETELLKISLATATLIMEGYIYLPKTGKQQRRLTNLLNTDRRFLPITNVIVYDRATNARLHDNQPLIEVNVDKIEYIKPYL